MRLGHVLVDDRPMLRRLAAASAVSMTLVVACGDDAPSTAAYCEDLAALDDGSGGGPVDVIFERYGDNPTLDEWAEGLPEVLEVVRDFRGEFAAIEPSADLEDERAAALGALDAVVRNFEGSLEAAEAGDQEAFDRHEAANHGELSPAMGEAMARLVEACEAATT
jgi:hypothetical protein